MQTRTSASGRPATTTGSDKIRIDVDWFKSEAQTIDCNSDDIKRWHLKKLLDNRIINVDFDCLRPPADGLASPKNLQNNHRQSQAIEVHFDWLKRSNG